MKTMATAWHAVNDVGEVEAGERVAIQGAESIRLCVPAAAKAKGSLVAIPDSVDYRLEAARRLGADLTVDIKRKDLSGRGPDITGAAGFDKVIEAVVVMGVFAGERNSILAERMSDGPRSSSRVRAGGMPASSPNAPE